MTSHALTAAAFRPSAGSQALRSFYGSAPTAPVHYAHRLAVVAVVTLAVSLPMLGLVAYTGI